MSVHGSRSYVGQSLEPHGLMRVGLIRPSDGPR